MDFFTKIQLLKTLEIIDEEGAVTRPFDTTIYTSLKAIGAVRNAFQHHLDYSEALGSLTNGDKFVFGKKNPLSSYDNVEMLKNDFITEASSLYDNLHNFSLNQV